MVSLSQLRVVCAKGTNHRRKRALRCVAVVAVALGLGVVDIDAELTRGACGGMGLFLTTLAPAE